MSEKNALEQVMNTTDLTSQYIPEDIAEGKLMSILSYLWILFFLPLVVCPGSKFGRFHANQAVPSSASSVSRSSPGSSAPFWVSLTWRSSSSASTMPRPEKPKSSR